MSSRASRAPTVVPFARPDLTEAEIAGALGCAPGTVKSQAAAAMKALRRALAASGVGLGARSVRPGRSTCSARAVLDDAGVDLAAIRGSAKPVMRELPGLAARATIMEREGSRLTAPNTVGILEGTDPALRKQYLVFSAHMDHIGVTPGGADSVNNGADDDASGTTGVIELAEAFSRAGGRPKRSIIFLTVSGEEKGLWGSNFFTSNPPVPIKQIVADNAVAIGVIATPAPAAQSVADRMVAAGITSILNFAPCVLVVPDGVDVRQHFRRATPVARPADLEVRHLQRRPRPFGHLERFG